MLCRTQYDAIVCQYDEWRDSLDAIIEKENMRLAVSPLIKGSNVLDLACGSGFYSFDLLEWGAKSVLGVDISEEMIAAAERKASSHVLGSKIKFKVGDVAQPALLPGSPFDLVTAGWLLTYAPDLKSLTKMFETVAVNLKPGGKFITTVIRPSSDPMTAFTDGTLSFWMPDYFHIKPLHAIPDGVRIRCHAGRQIFWDSHYLRQEAYESAARDAGLTGVMEYRKPEISDEISRRMPHDFQPMTRLSGGKTSLHFNILSISK